MGKPAHTSPKAQHHHRLSCCPHLTHLLVPLLTLGDTQKSLFAYHLCSSNGGTGTTVYVLAMSQSGSVGIPVCMYSVSSTSVDVSVSIHTPDACSTATWQHGHIWFLTCSVL